MPGPIFVVADSIDAFHSCEDVHEAWGCNGDSLQEATYNNHDSQHYKIQYNTIRHVNGETKADVDVESTMTSSAITTPSNDKMDEGHKNDDPEVKRNETITDRSITSLKESQEDMELGEEGGEEGMMPESMNIPVVEARLNLDINRALTRQKIASIQRGRTLSYVDRDDSEEAPTRRTKLLYHNRDSIEIGGGGGGPFTNKPNSGEPETIPSIPPRTEKNVKVSRNPSYHTAVREAGVDSPLHVVKTEPLNIQKSSSSSSSSENSPGHEPREPSTLVVQEKAAENSRRSVSPKLKKNLPLDLPVAANMPRSASFSGGGLLSPSSPANSSLGIAYGRRGSTSTPSTPVTKRATDPITALKGTTRNIDNNCIPARGSAITRSFKRLFSTPLRSAPVSSTPPEDFWTDSPDLEPGTPPSERPTSRLRKLSTTLTRKLSTRSKMSNSYTFPTGTNDLTPNGETIPDTSSLVDYEQLMKLFSCSGCQGIMSPPLHQCRKGHLVCSVCRLSLKQVCPVCKQRFADTTNLMMEQVCHLVKFPCKYSSSGCLQFHPPKSRLDHEQFCVYRPLHCHHASRGCKKVLLLRDMHQHLDECEFRDK